MPGWSGWSGSTPRARLRAAAGVTGPRPPHILASPPGTAAPIGAINYTPSTGEIHHPGVLAPIHELNYSLLPADSLGAGGGHSQGKALGAGAAYGTAPPGQPAGGRYPSSPSTLRNTFSPGQPPLSPSPYLTGPAPRAPVSGPGPRPFSERSAMWGSLGAGQAVSDVGYGTPTATPTPTDQDQGGYSTRTDVDPFATPTPTPGPAAPAAATPAAPAPAAGSTANAADGSTDDGSQGLVGPEATDAAAVLDHAQAVDPSQARTPPTGWHPEGNAPGVDPNPAQPSALWWVNGDRTKFILVGFIRYVRGQPPTLIKADSKQAAASSHDQNGNPLPELQAKAAAPATKTRKDPDGINRTYEYDPATGDYTKPFGTATSQPGQTTTKDLYDPQDGAFHTYQWNPATGTFDKDLGPSKTQPKGTTAGGTTSASALRYGVGDRQQLNDGTVIVAKEDPSTGRQYWDVDPVATARNQTQPQFTSGGVYIPPGGQMDINYGPRIGTMHFATPGAQTSTATAAAPSLAPTLPAGSAGIPGEDPGLSGAAAPPRQITRPSGESITVQPGESPPQGAGADTFMGRGLTPQTGRGSTGIGWQSPTRGWVPGAGHTGMGGSLGGGMGGSGMSGGGGVGQDQPQQAQDPTQDPLIQYALQLRAQRGQGAAPPSDGAAQPGGASPSPSGPGWTPPLPPQAVAGIGHRFGQSMNVGEPQHSGVDLQAPEGTDTVSPVDGMVERVEHNPAGLGLTVIIRGKDGSEHRLGHLSRTEAYPGMVVAQGQDLQSKVGSSGNTTGSHLHWGVRDQQGQPVDNTTALGQMANMPPVPGTEMMGPPGGTLGPGGPPAGASGETGLGGPPEAPPPQGAGQEAPRAGWNPGMRSSWIVRPIGAGQDTSSKDYQAGYQAGIQASKSPGTPPIFVPAMQQPIPTASDQQRQGAGQASGAVLADPGLAQHLGTANPPTSRDPQTGQPAYTVNWSDGTTSQMTRDQIIADLQDAGIDPGQHDPVSVYLMLAAGRTSELPSDVNVPTPRTPLPAATAVPTQTGPGLYTPSADELSREANDIALRLMDEGQQILQTQGTQAYEAWAKQQDARLSVLNQVLSNPYLQMLSGMAPGPGESAGSAPNLQSLVSNLFQPYRFPSWFQPGQTEPGGAPYAGWTMPGTPASQGAAPANQAPPPSEPPPSDQPSIPEAQAPQAAPEAGAALAAPGVAGVAGQDPNLAGWNPSGQPIQVPQPSAQSDIHEGTARAPAEVGVGQDQVSTFTLNSLGYADTPEGRAQYAAGQPPSGNGAATPDQIAHAQQVMNAETAQAGPTSTSQASPNWQTWRGWNPFQRSSYVTNQLAGQLTGGQPWATTRQQLMAAWGSQGGGPDVTQMQRAAASPEQQIGQEMTGVLYGQTPQQWQQSEQKQWSRAQMPRIQQKLSGIAAQ